MVGVLLKQDKGERAMKRLIQAIALMLLLTHAAAGAGEITQNSSAPDLREEIWAIPSAVPMLAYMVRPIGEGPFPLLVMNHGVALDAKERSYFPVIEFRDAALWFARQGYVVVAPVRPGYAQLSKSPSEPCSGSFSQVSAIARTPTFEMLDWRLPRSTDG
jgi:hypothetical protein